MNLLLLGKFPLEVLDFITSCGDKYQITQDKIDSNADILRGADFLISYGYRHILKQPVLDQFFNKAINIHISLLPWNRGADPNLWSFLENTPKGVTIHYIDYGIDTGNILVQQEVKFAIDETLKTTYDKLAEVASELFMKYWSAIRTGEIEAKPQPLIGTYHCLKDRKQYESLLINGWDTPVKNLIGKALK